MTQPTTYADEYAALAGHFNAEWEKLSNALPLAWENVPLDEPNPPSGYVAFHVLNGQAGTVSIGAPGSNTVRHPGIINVNIFVPLDAGKPAALRVADNVAAILRSVSIQGILVREPSAVTIGPSGAYFQMNVSAPFQRDSLY